MRVSAAIKSLIHGVTTDNRANTSSNYFAKQVNTISRVDEGLAKRPPLTLVGDMGIALAAGDFVKEFIIHDVAYFIVVRQSPFSIETYREDGTEFVTTDLSGDTYLTGIAEDDLKIAVHGEIVFLLNKNVDVAMVTTDATAPTNSLLYIKAPIAQNVTINVTAVNNLNVKVTKTVVVPPTILGTSPDLIAAQIATAFNADANFSADNKGAVVQFVRTDGYYSQVTIDSDVGVNDFVVLNGQVDSFTDLPKYAYYNARQSVLPKDAKEGGEVYMRAVPESFKDEEDALGDPVAVWGTAPVQNIQFTWYNPSDVKIGGLPPDDGITYYLKYISADDGNIYLDGHLIEWIKLSYRAGSSAWDSYRRFAEVKFATTYPDGFLFETKNIRLAVNGDAQTTAYSLLSEWYGAYWANTMTGSWSPPPDYATVYDVWLDETAALPSVSTALVEVKWIEVADINVDIDIDRETMPHALTPSGDAFTYQQVNWTDRKAGDDTTNPLPKFIGSSIEDIIIFQNRLAVLTNDEFVASESGDVFNFFRDTVTQVLSKHPVNVRSTSTNSSKLRFFVYHNRDLLITAARRQYKISGKIALTPQTASMELTTSYHASETVEPVGVGSAVYIPSHSGEFLHVSKYVGSNENLNPDEADNITQHVRKYITGNVNRLAGLPNHGLIFAHATDGQEIFVCNYDTDISRSEEKRYAWFKWNDFTNEAYTIHSIATVKNTLLVVINTQFGLQLLSMDMDANSASMYLDYYQTYTNVSATIVDLGPRHGVDPDQDSFVVVQGEGCPNPGDYIDYALVNNQWIVLDFIPNGTIHVGREFTASAVPNLVTIKDEGGFVNNSANLRLRKFEIRVLNTGIMTATEQSPYDTYDVQEFTGLVTGSLDAITDQEAKTSAVFKVGFKQSAENGTLLIESKSWLPMLITQIDWVGNYKSRGRRL